MSKAQRSTVGSLEGAVPLASLAPPGEGEIWVIVGPTATGKTALAIELARQHGGEVISADSVQIYRHFDLGSGKPSEEERAGVPHHLLDAIDPNDPIDAQRFAQLADVAIAEVRGRGHLPIVCGGTYLWVKALIEGLAELPPGDEAVRQRHRAFASERGPQALHAQLAEVDPEAAARLSPNDTLRVSRALEVFELTGTPQSTWHREHAATRAPRYPHRLIGPARDHDEVDRRIAARVHMWTEQGWVDEVRRLIERGYGESRAMGSVGYKQVRAFVGGELREEDLAEQIIRATRVFARRQRTWLRGEPVSWVI